MGILIGDEIHYNLVFADNQVIVSADRDHQLCYANWIKIWEMRKEEEFRTRFMHLGIIV